MSDDIEIEESPHEEIERLEARIEELVEHLQRCSKLAVFAKALLAGGALWLAAGIFGIVGLAAPSAMGSITAILAGFILGGSNRSTMQQYQAQLDAAEARRSALIGTINLRTVSAQDSAFGEQPVRRLH
jgi:hypothetical protein